jgi:hypothetical protein
MPTMRLGDNERSELCNAFHRIIVRAKNNVPFPLQEHDFPEFGYDLLEPRIAKHYEFLRDEAEFLTTSSGWNPDFNIGDGKFVYNIAVPRMNLPHDGLLLPETHPRHAEILEWAIGYDRMSDRVSAAQSFLNNIVECCSSTGQIRRVLSDDILRFVPEYMQNSFKDAERKSRIPASLGMDGFAESIVELTDILALGTLSPEEMVGIDASVDNKTAI